MVDGFEVIGRDKSVVCVIIDRWSPMPGYEARTTICIDGKTDERFGKTTQLRKTGETEWFRA